MLFSNLIILPLAVRLFLWPFMAYQLLQISDVLDSVVQLLTVLPLDFSQQHNIIVLIVQLTQRSPTYGYDACIIC